MAAPLATLAQLSPERIAIVKPSALGDILHSLPVLTALKHRFPNAHLTWIVNTTYESILKGHPDLDATLPFNRLAFRGGVRSGIRSQRDFYRRLRDARFDLAIDLQCLFRSGLISRLTGAPVRIGLASAREGSRYFYTHLVNDGGTDAHAVDRYWKVVEALGDAPSEKIFRLPVDPEARVWAREQLAGCPRPWLAIGVGARWLTKRWPPTHFAELARRAIDRFGGTALFVGSPDERPLAIEAAVPLAGAAKIFAGDTTMSQLVALLDAADVVIANDTGPLHLAVALGRPVVAPFTCTSVRKTGPYGQFARAIETTVWCQGHEIRTCSRMECMAELTPLRLWPPLEEVLQSWRHNSRPA